MHLMLAATPDSGWWRLHPLLDHLGLEVPGPDALARWRIALAALESAPVARALATDSVLSRFRVGCDELLATCRAPAVVVMDEHPDWIEPWLEEDDQARLLLLYSRPEAALAGAMERGQCPGPSLSAWDTSARRLLAIHRRHRARALLVETERALLAPNLLLQALGQFLNLNPEPWTGALEMPAGPPAALNHLIAAQQVMQTPAMPELLGELEASALTLGGVLAWPAIDCDGVWREVRGWARSGEQASDSSGVKGENARQPSLSGLTHQDSSSLEPKPVVRDAVNGDSEGAGGDGTQALESADGAMGATPGTGTPVTGRSLHKSGMTQVFPGSGRSNDRETSSEARLMHELLESRSENDLLLLRLHQAHEEIERLHQRWGGSHQAPRWHAGDDGDHWGDAGVDGNREGDDDPHALTPERAALMEARHGRRRAEAQLERMRRTLSWRITAPLRWGMRPIKRRLIRRGWMS